MDGSSPNNFTPFSNELKKKTGLTSTEFYLEAMEYYKEKFKKEKFEEYEQVSLKLDIPTNYRYSFKYKNSLISLKKSYDEKASFYEIDNRNEKKILGLGILSDDYFELKNNKIIWAEIEPDLRNEKVNYSNIKIYDLDKNEKVNITNKLSKMLDDIKVKYNIGKVIVDAQGWKYNSNYGNRLIKEWSKDLIKQYGSYFSVENLKNMRTIYLKLDEDYNNSNYLNFDFFLLETIIIPEMKENMQ